MKLEKDYQQIVSQNKILIERLARLSLLSKEFTQSDELILITVEGGEFALYVSELIDIAVEKTRLLKTLEKNNEDCLMLRNKLANEKFISQAPQEVINDSRTRLTELEQNVVKLSSALQRLEGASLK